MKNCNTAGIQPKKRALDIIAKTTKWAFLISLVCFAVVPFLWLVMISFKTHGEFLKYPLALPEKWMFVNYANAFMQANMGMLLFNSIVITFGAMGINIIATSLGAFVLTRVQFPFAKLITNVVLMAVLIPIISFMIPYTQLIRSLNLYNTRMALILTYAAINIPISFFIIEGFMREIPMALEEAAVIEGAGLVRRFVDIVLPLCSSGLVTAGTLCFIYAWNEFAYAMLLTSSTSVRTVQLAISLFTTQFRSDFPTMYAAIVITMVPSVLLYIFLHNKIIGGFTAGAIKG